MSTFVAGARGQQKVFLQRACGDVNPTNNLSADQPLTPGLKARVVDGRLGAEAVNVLLSVARGADIPVAARQKTWTIKRRVPSAERVAVARKVLTQPKPAAVGEARTEWIFAKETLMLSYLVSVEPAVEVEVQALQIGPAVCITNPAEYFVEYGLYIKKQSRFPFTFPVELANGCVGYVPTQEAFSSTGGGYETRLTSYSNLEVTAGNQFAESGLSLASGLAPAAPPEFKRIATPRKPWPYGNNAPEIE